MDFDTVSLSSADQLPDEIFDSGSADSETKQNSNMPEVNPDSAAAIAEAIAGDAASDAGDDGEMFKKRYLRVFPPHVLCANTTKDSPHLFEHIYTWNKYDYKNCTNTCLTARTTYADLLPFSQLSPTMYTTEINYNESEFDKIMDELKMKTM